MRTLRLLFTALVLCLPVSLFAATSMSGFVAAMNNLTLAPDAANVSNATWTVGHMTVHLGSGSISRVMAGSEPVGVYFKGSGTFDYVTVEATELPVVDHNVKAVSHVRMTGDAQHATLSGDFGDVLILGGGVTMPEVTGSGGAALGDAFAQHKTLYDRLRAMTASHVIAVQKFSFPATKRVIAQFSGGRDNILYDYDDTEDHDESLSTVAPPSSFTGDKRIQQRLYLNLLSDQPVGHDHWTAAKPPFALTALDFSLTADGDNAKADVTETLVRPAAGENVLRFSMAYEEIVKENIAARTFHVRSVTDDQGKALPFDHHFGDLVVDVSGVNSPAIKLKFVIDGDFLVREGGDNAWQLGLGEPWFPLPRQLGAWAYTVHSLVKVKKPFVPFTPGTTLARREEGDYNVVETVLDKPVAFTMVQAGKYQVSEEKRGDRTIRVATYGLRNDRAAKQLTDLAFGIIEYYEFFLGPFPWSEFNIIQMNTYGYGQAPPATMFITSEAFQPTQSLEDQIFSEGINERFAHEIAHQYWGYVVREASSEETWLSESFAEYSAALALKKLMPRGEAVYNKLVSTWKGGAKMGVNVAPIPYANRIEGDGSVAFRQRFALLYEKGPYLLYTLHKELGDTTFLTFMKSYQKSFAWKAGTTKDVAGLLGFMTKKDYKPFFEQYYYGTVMPQ
ncbi:MAG TPA: M1 family aminopeptidase [Thermoanaerobaculia bacterium]|nr:M1 family aminopeptidase [Thermoanaerobaculia bacterium]